MSANPHLIYSAICEIIGNNQKKQGGKPLKFKHFKGPSFEMLRNR